MLNGVEVSFNLLDNELKKNSGELEFASVIKNHLIIFI